MGDWLTRKEAAQRLQVSLKTFDRLVREGVVPKPAKLGERITRWWRDDLDAGLRCSRTTDVDRMLGLR